MKRREGMPGLVYWGLWGLQSRKSAVAFMVFSAVAGLACLIYGFFDRTFLLGALLPVAALWFWYSVRWVDRSSSWEQSPAPPGPVAAPVAQPDEQPRE